MLPKKMRLISLLLLLVVLQMGPNSGFTVNAGAPPPGECDIGLCPVAECCPGAGICLQDGNGGFCTICGPCDGGGGPGASDSPTISPTQSPSKSPSKSPSTAPTQLLRTPTQSPTEFSFDRIEGYLLLLGGSYCDLNGTERCCQDRYSVVTFQLYNTTVSRTVYLNMSMTSSGSCLNCPEITALSFGQSDSLAQLSDGRKVESVLGEADLLRFTTADNNCTQEYSVRDGEVLERIPVDDECLSGDGLVQTASSMKRVDQLRIGTLVEVASGVFEPIIYFSRHWNQRGERSDVTAVAEFLEIFTTNKEGTDKKPVLLSKGHMIQVIQRHADGEKAIPAGQVRVGDFVFDSDHQMMRVEKLGRTVQKGAYSPVTPSCRMIVDGVLVSCLVESPYHPLVLGLIQVLNVLYQTLPLPVYSALVENVDYVIGLGYLENGPVSLLATYVRQMIQIVSV